MLVAPTGQLRSGVSRVVGQRDAGAPRGV